MEKFIISSDQYLRNYIINVEKLKNKAVNLMFNPFSLSLLLFIFCIVFLYFSIRYYEGITDVFEIVTLIIILLVFFMLMMKSYFKLRKTNWDSVVLFNHNDEFYISQIEEVNIDDNLEQLSEKEIELSESKTNDYNINKVKGASKSLSDKDVDHIYNSFNFYGVFNYYNVSDEFDKEPFTKEYFEDRIRELYKEGKTEKFIYLTCNQKVAGALIFDVINPMINRDSSKISEFFYYQKKGEFVQVNYSSIDSPIKRAALKR